MDQKTQRAMELAASAIRSARQSVTALAESADKRQLAAELDTCEQELKATASDAASHQLLSRRAIEVSMKATRLADLDRARAEWIAAGGGTVSPLALTHAYLDWLLAEAKRESARGCETILAVRSELSMYFADITQGWTPEAQSALMRACIKRRIFGSRASATEALSPAEEHAYSNFRWPVAFGTPTLSDAHRARVRGDVHLERGKLRRALRASLEPVLGKGNYDPSGLWSFATSISGVRLITEVDTGGRTGQVKYWHRFAICDRPNLVQMTLFALLGESQTTWSFLSTPDIPDMARLLARLCSDFIQDVPSIVDAGRIRSMNQPETVP